MAEPIPSASTAAADAADDETQPLPNNAEDRKAAAALNSLNANEISQDNHAASKQPSAADQEALGKAMSRLEIASGNAGKKKADEAAKKKDEGKAKDEIVKKKVKIASDDVTFLVEELDLTKAKATELLRAHDGNAITAIRAFIAPAVKV